jgi:hypothetical protein
MTSSETIRDPLWVRVLRFVFAPSEREWRLPSLVGHRVQFYQPLARRYLIGRVERVQHDGSIRVAVPRHDAPPLLFSVRAQHVTMVDP